ncbi:MAG TPA: hypothetical protein VGQ46_13495 [Thermoanaerobaculia bacterium]|jgi:hypothetical protein|nr:hypothetical protein [Thermoanaerobaculia bacterium]
MNEQETIQHVNRLRKRVQALEKKHSGEPIEFADLYGKTTPPSPAGLKAEVVEFLKLAAGPKSEFSTLAQAAGGTHKNTLRVLDSILEGFVAHVNAGLQSAIGPRRQVQIEVVSDLLEQVNLLLETKGVHPAAPIVILGATLEEYLRTTVEQEGLSIGNRKPGLQAYADTLREADLLSKQDCKDITAWAGIRNHAAHGEWEEVKDPARAKLMLQGINLFLRQRGA